MDPLIPRNYKLALELSNYIVDTLQSLHDPDNKDKYGVDVQEITKKVSKIIEVEIIENILTIVNYLNLRIKTLTRPDISASICRLTDYTENCFVLLTADNHKPLLTHYKCARMFKLVKDLI